MVGFYATEVEAGAMMRAAEAEGKTLADWLRSLIPAKDDGLTQKPTKPRPAKKP